MNLPFSASLRAWLRPLLVTAALGLVHLPAGAALGKEPIHTVQAGQRLGSIAKRYGISVDALCRANGIEKTEKIKPGLKLVIPDKKTPLEEIGLSPESAKAKEKPAPLPEAKKPNPATTAKTNTPPKPKKKPAPQEPKLHVVAAGQTLGAIANRNGTTISAICNASGIQRDANLRLGQRILVPHKTDEGGDFAKKLRIAGEYELNPPRLQTRASAQGGTWKKYTYAPRKSGYVSLYHYGRKWQGYVVGKKGTILPQAQKSINWILGARSSGPYVDNRLLLLLSHVSDHFGGRTIRIVSGYRTTSWVDASKHREGRAVDFSVPGVPNEVLRDYLRTLRHVGVGYYPNSSFVHLDVRGYNAYWVDYAGPGERPRLTKNRPKHIAKPTEPHGSDEGDDEAEDAERHEPTEKGEEAKDQEARPDDLPDDVKELPPTPADEPSATVEKVRKEVEAETTSGGAAGDAPSP